MGWKYEYKCNLWSNCAAKGHLPVAVAVAGSSVNLFCAECGKVWRVATAGRLQSVAVSDLGSLEDSVWKSKVLSLVAGKL